MTDRRLKLRSEMSHLFAEVTVDERQPFEAVAEQVSRATGDACAVPASQPASSMQSEQARVVKRKQPRSSIGPPAPAPAACPGPSGAAARSYTSVYAHLHQPSRRLFSLSRRGTLVGRLGGASEHFDIMTLCVDAVELIQAAGHRPAVAAGHAAGTAIRCTARASRRPGR